MTWFEIVRNITNFDIIFQKKLYIQPNEPTYGFRLAANLFLDQVGKKHLLLYRHESANVVLQIMQKTLILSRFNEDCVLTTYL